MSTKQSVAPRILICRLSHIGDCILTLPMLHALRRRWPTAWIAWAMERPTPDLLDIHPEIDEIITVPKGWLKRPRTILHLRHELKKRRFDIVVDPQSICKSSMLGWLSAARVRVGFGGQHARELSHWFNNRLVEVSSDHLADRSLELLNGLDITVDKPQFNLPVSESARAFAADFLCTAGLAERNWIVINPGASWASKRWETDRFAEVAARLLDQFDTPSVVTWAGDTEAAMSADIVRLSRGAACLAPRTSLPQLAALLARSSLFVGCDTGPLHLAASVGTTCVGLYGPTRPQDSGAWGPQHYALQNRYHSGTCRERRNAGNQAMQTIAVDEVVEACGRAMAARGDALADRQAA